MRKKVEPRSRMQFRAGAAKEGKVKFNLKNVHIAVKVTGENGDVTYEKPFPHPGAVSLALDPQGQLSPFYADGIKYYVSSSNGGYEGDLEIAVVTDEYRQKILKEELDTNKVMFENSNVNPVEFALLFEVDGDQKSTRFAFYNCTSTRPGAGSKTTEDTKEPGTETMTISCAPGADGTVRAKTTKETAEDVYNNWYNEVYTRDKGAA